MRTWPQLFMAAWLIGTFLGSLSKSWEWRTPGPALLAALENAAFVILLVFGGFFAVWGWAP